MANPNPDDPRKPVQPRPDPEAEETAHLDDAIIARAFRVSAIVLLVIAVAGGAVYFYLHRKPAPVEARITHLTAPVTAATRSVDAPAARFSDITTTAGIRFIHNSGAVGDKLLPESMGSGCAFLDYDGDGHPDLLLVNGTWWPWNAGGGRKPTTLALYHNDGKGGFTDVTAGSGLEVPLHGCGVAVGDYDNDGLPDIFISGVGESRLFHNRGGGRFEDVTTLAGVAGATNDWGTSCAWIDYDNDGRLDLFVCHYVRWSREIDFEVGYKLVGYGRAYGQPMNFEGAHPTLYHNDGGGKFTDVSDKAGVRVKNPSTGRPMGKSLGVAPIDLDGDGFIDLIVANDTVQNFVFHNERNGTFKEIGAESGIAFDSYGMARGAMGIDTAHYRNDNKLGIVIGNFANEMTALYVSQAGPLSFADEAIPEGIGPSSRLLLKFGEFFFDYDLDGRLDILSANGHLEEDIGKIQHGQNYRQPAQLFWNHGAGFSTVPEARCGADIYKPMVGRGSAFADIDGDGDLDVIITQTGGAPLLLRNEQALGNHWIRFKLTGTKSNRDAIGAWVRVRSGNVIQTRQVMPTRSYLSQSEPDVTFGLGKDARIDEVSIVWPRGGKQVVTGWKVDALNRVEEP